MYSPDLTETRENRRHPGTLQVTKQNEYGQPLSGVSFMLEYSADNGSSWAPVTLKADDGLPVVGGCTSSGLSNGQLTTDSSGVVSYNGLWADGSVLYRVTETATANGYSLLGDPLYVGSLPIEVSSYTVADSETIDGNSYTYTLYVTATDDPLFRLPEAGAPGFGYIALSLLLTAAFTFYIIIRKDSIE